MADFMDHGMTQDLTYRRIAMCGKLFDSFEKEIAEAATFSCRARQGDAEGFIAKRGVLGRDSPQDAKGKVRQAIHWFYASRPTVSPDRFNLRCAKEDCGFPLCSTQGPAWDSGGVANLNRNAGLGLSVSGGWRLTQAQAASWNRRPKSQGNRYCLATPSTIDSPDHVVFLGLRGEGDFESRQEVAQ